MTGARFHRDRRASERFVGFECEACGWISFPEERSICKRCGAAPADYTEVDLRREGPIQTFVIQEYSPEALPSPQPIAIVELPQTGDGEPARVFGLLTESDPDEVSIGATVRARFRNLLEDGDRPIHAFKFSLVEGAER